MSYEEPKGLEVDVEIDAPREAVFDIVSATDRWPELITVIEDGEVLTDHARGEDVELRWDVTVAGVTVEVFEKIDGYERPELLTWTSLDGSRWNHEGGIRFEETDEGATSVYAWMDYDVPAVVDNRVFRWLFKRRFQKGMERSFGNVRDELED